MSNPCTSVADQKILFDLDRLNGFVLIWEKLICMEMASYLYGKTFISARKSNHTSGLQGLILPRLSAFHGTRHSVPVAE
jgi:hypothetical protein